jgi:hypothetical protein
MWVPVYFALLSSSAPIQPFSGPGSTWNRGVSCNLDSPDAEEELNRKGDSWRFQVATRQRELEGRNDSRAETPPTPTLMIRAIVASAVQVLGQRPFSLRARLVRRNLKSRRRSARNPSHWKMMLRALLYDGPRAVIKSLGSGHGSACESCFRAGTPEASSFAP